MKVLIASPWFHPVIGGVENYVEQIAKQFVADGIEVHIVTASDRTETEVWNGMTIHRLKTWFVLSNTPVSLLWGWQIRRLIKRVKPDVINVHAPVPSIALATTAAAGSTPLVVTYHAGSIIKGKPLVDLLIFGYQAVMLPWMLNRADAIICASDFVHDTFLSKWQNKSLTVTPGVDTNAFSPQKAKKVHGQIVFVGNYSDPRKGLDVLLEAMQSLPQLTLRVVGYGKPTPQDRVKYLGELRGDALYREMGSAEALVLPSTTDAEAFGTVLIEAMACGVAVIGSKVGGVGGVISDGEDGYLVAPGDPAELVYKIKRLLETPRRAYSFGQAGRRKAVNKYNWKSLTRTTEGVLMRAAASRAVSAEVRNG